MIAWRMREALSVPDRAADWENPMNTLDFRFDNRHAAKADMGMRQGGSLWSRGARFVSLWRKQIRDRADLSAMSQRELQDIGFPGDGSAGQAGVSGEQRQEVLPRLISHSRPQRECSHCEALERVWSTRDGFASRSTHGRVDWSCFDEPSALKAALIAIGLTTAIGAVAFIAACIHS